jgi:hypothetical protein
MKDSEDYRLEMKETLERISSNSGYMADSLGTEHVSVMSYRNMKLNEIHKALVKLAKNISPE